jgi:secreted trypsin-like serine protease
LKQQRTPGALVVRVRRHTAVLTMLLIVVCSIGSQPVAKAIIGGTAAQNGEFPWMAALLSTTDGSQFCGGSLIAAEWVLTAGHCFFEQQTQSTFAADVQVLLGTLDVSDNSGSLHSVSEIRLPAGFVNGTNDIALLRLTTPADLNDPAIDLLPLIDPGDETTLAAPGVRATVAGWGATNPDGSTASDVLLHVEVPIVSKETCNPGGLDPEIDNNLLCAGGEAGSDSCSGDSGGPLFIATNGGFVQAGIVHAGPQICAQSNQYGLYTRVALFRTWIAQQTGVDAADQPFRVYVPIAASG